MNVNQRRHDDMRSYIRNKVHRHGYSATARWCARNGIGNPRWFLLIVGDLLPRRPQRKLSMAEANYYHSLQQSDWAKAGFPLSTDMIAGMQNMGAIGSPFGDLLPKVPR